MGCMSGVITVLIILGLLLLGAGIVLMAGKKGEPSKGKSRAARLKEGTRRINQNPRDKVGLQMLGEVYIQDENWERAFAIYNMLMEMAKDFLPSEQFDIYLRHGIVSLKTQHYDEAKKGFLLARTVDPNHFDVNYNLGYIYYIQHDYEKASPLFRKALIVQQDHIAAIKYLGFTLQQLRKYNEALPYLKKVITVEPDNKDALFNMAMCLLETGRNEQALKIFYHLRADPKTGPQACLYSGIVHEKLNLFEKARDDFELGMRHETLPPELKIEIQYHLARVFIKEEDLTQALRLLRMIQAARPGFKDTSVLINRYQELNQNKNLHTYLMAGQSRFIALCRRIVTNSYTDARIKITDIAVQATYTDIVAEVDTSRWADTTVFRFFRSQGTVGELLLRDFHGRVKDLKAGTGTCMCAGTFSEEAKRFAEGRPLNLYGKEKLNKMLNALA